jgi:AraC-like DNA-binding protein
MTLLANRRPLAEIADRLGFASAAVFSRWFKQKFDCSPSKWHAISTATNHSQDVGTGLHKRRSSGKGRIRPVDFIDWSRSAKSR